MKKIHLNGMNLDVLVWDTFFFYDDGEVESLKEHDKKLCEKYGINFFENEGHFKGGGSYNIFSTRNNKDKSLKSLQKSLLHAHIYILDRLGINESIFMKAHEEGHVLLYTGLEKQFYDFVGNQGYDVATLPRNDEEVIVSVGGLCAVEQRNPGQSTIILKGMDISYVNTASNWMLQNIKKDR